MSALELVYEVAVAAARPLARAVSPAHDKLRRGEEGRRHAVERLEAWSREHRDPARPLAWLHAPSVGESLMAQAIITAFRELEPAAQIAFTHFSPSAERVADRVGADVVSYLPWDERRDMARALAALRPAVIAFVRSETWPVLTRQAVAAGVRLVLVNGVLAEDSSRLSGPARSLLSPSYRRLDAVGVVTAEHGARFRKLGVPDDRIVVTGDARFDQVWSRVAGLAANPASRPVVALLRDPAVFTVVAGSTWPADEAVLLPSFAALKSSSPARLVIAPHEPTPYHLRRLERALDDMGLAHARLSAIERDRPALPEVVVIDRVGVLADAYAAGDAAYVGGGFHRAGLHSVVEPAALGVPVVYGTRHGAAREAAELAVAGGGFVVPDVAALTARLQTLAGDSALRAEAGAAARRYVVSQLGGARRNAELIRAVLHRRAVGVANEGGSGQMGHA